MKYYLILRGWDDHDCSPSAVGVAATFEAAFQAAEIIKTKAENDTRGHDIKIVLRWEEKDVQTYDRAYGYLTYSRLWWKYSKEFKTELDLLDDEYYDQEMSDEIVGIKEIDFYENISNGSSTA